MQVREGHAPATPGSKPAERPAGKALLGFGPVGWALLMPLGALIVVAATGYDLRYQIQHLVNEQWGWEGLRYFTLDVVFGHAWASIFWPPLPHFGLVALCIVLVGLHLHPGRAGVVRIAILAAIGVAMPVGLFSMQYRNAIFHTGDSDSQFALTRLIAGTIVAAALWLATRSTRVGLLSGAVMLIAPALDWAALMAATGELPASLGPQIDHARLWAGVAMNAALAGILWTWGIRARLAIRPEHCCEACGYDRRGLEGQACPECGASGG